MPLEATPPSVESSVAAAVEKVERAAPAPVAAEPKPAPATEPVDKGTRAPDGRFVGKQADPATGATADTPAHIAKPPELPGVEEGKPATVEDDAPSSWRDPVKAKWQALDPEVKAEIKRRERDVNVGLQHAAEARRFGDSVYKEIAPYMEQLRGENASPQTAVRVLFETAYTLRHGSPEHKKAIILGLIQQYGVDMASGVDMGRAAVERELDARRTEDMRNGAGRAADELAAANDELQKFAAAPGHEHLPVLRTHMMALLQGGVVRTLEEAYDQAARAHPEVRKAVAKQDLDRVAELGKHRDAASSVTGAPGAAAVTAVVDPKNLRGLIEAQFAGGGARRV